MSHLCRLLQYILKSPLTKYRKVLSHCGRHCSAGSSHIDFIVSSHVATFSFLQCTHGINRCIVQARASSHQRRSSQSKEALKVLVHIRLQTQGDRHFALERLDQRYALWFFRGSNTSGSACKLVYKWVTSRAGIEQQSSNHITASHRRARPDGADRTLPLDVEAAFMKCVNDLRREGVRYRPL